MQTSAGRPSWGIIRLRGLSLLIRNFSLERNQSKLCYLNNNTKIITAYPHYSFLMIFLDISFSWRLKVTTNLRKPYPEGNWHESRHFVFIFKWEFFFEKFAVKVRSFCNHFYSFSSEKPFRKFWRLLFWRTC